MRKFFSIFTSIFCLVFVITACSAGTSEKSLESIKEKGTIKIGSSTTGPPFSFMNSKNELDGLMIDIVKEIAKGLEVKTEIQGMQFSSLIPAIEADKIDLISAGMIITDERKKVIDFSEPIYSYGEGLVVSNTDNTIKTLDDLAGKKVGVQQGTIYLDGLSDYPKIQPQTYKSIADMVSELQNGRIDAFFADYPIIIHMIKENPDFKIKLVDSYEPIWTGDVGIGLPKEVDDLKRAVNDEINQLKESGELDAIIAKWGLN
ncbi:substrate-binding periplasmic protein [Bacillus tuaregi]|uniref:substrate-binding periplasmic protein n=1 Tax=Bacillus tuaregi TaxID=1816695 RepID=UPI0008F879A0|nr:ABC transporter substrate-binding protein [Bacillus tuaregi]